MEPTELHARLAEIVSQTGPFAPAVLLVASFMEHVFPPFPGDMLVMLGAWYAVHGELSWLATFASVTAGAVIGAALDWRIGGWLGARLEERVEQRARDHHRLTPERIARFEARYRRFGPWLLVGNRFLPGLRAFLFVAAGAARVPLRDVLLYGGLSAALWNAALLGAGALVAHNVEELAALLQRYTHAAVAVLVALGALWILWRAWRRLRGAREAV